MFEITWAAKAPASRPGDLLVVASAVGADLGSCQQALGISGLAAALEAARFRGKAGDAFKLAREREGHIEQILLVGVGAPPAETAAIRRLGFAAARAAVPLGVTRVVLDPRLALREALERDAAHVGRTIATGLALGAYRYERYVAAAERKPDALREVVLVGPDAAAAGTGPGQIVADATALARDLANGPADLVTPTYLAEQARALAETLAAAGHDVDCRILERDECERLGMGCFLGVARGSDTPPKFVHAVYRPPAPARARICLVGKGVTFDSGGYSLKPSEAMYGMKLDMAGAATVLGALSGAARLRVPYEVHAITAAAENMVSGHAYRLGDVLTASDGTTVEINNTDAEGRLTLADALIYAGRLEPDCVIDFATLTGACVVALGPHIGGVMGTSDALAERWLAAAAAAGEDMWRLPLPEALNEMLESKIADLRNTGERWGGALTAGLFLRRFAGERPWLHVDIAGPGMCEKPFDVHIEGGTGFGVATTLQLLSGELDAVALRAAFVGEATSDPRR